MNTPNLFNAQFGLRFKQGFIVAVALISGGALMAATVVKKNNSDLLSFASSWTNGVAPGAQDTAQWDATVTSAANSTNTLGGDLTWSRIAVVNPAAPVEINGANTLTLTNVDMSSATVDLGLNCGLNLNGNATWTLADGRTLSIGSAIGGSGNINQQGGQVKLVAGLGALPSSAIYTFSNPTTLDLGGNNQTLNSMIPAWGATNVIRNGTLTNSLAAGDYSPGTQLNNSTEDFTGLSSFAVNNTNRTFNFNSGGTSGGIGIYMYLATNNLLALNNLYVGTASGASSGASPVSYLYLGQNNVINANNFNICGNRASGSVQFKSGLSNPYLKIRAANGLNRLPNLIIGKYSSGSQSGFGTLDLTGGTLDCVVSVLMVGEHSPNAASGATGTLVIDGSTSSVDVQTSATIAQRDTGSGTPTVTGTIRHLAGNVKVTTLTVGNNLGSSSGTTIKAAYQMGGGTLRVKTLQGGTVGASENTSSFRTFFWTNGVIQNYDSGNGLTAQGSLVISAAGLGTRFLRTDASLQNTISCILKQAAGASPIVVDGAGTLDLQGVYDNAYLSLNVSNGIVLLDKTSAPTVHAVGGDLSLNGGNVYLAPNGGSGGDQISDGSIITLNTGTLDLYGQSETIGGLAGTGGTLADASGSGTLTINVANGTTNICAANLSAGNLVIGLASGGGTGTQILTGSDSRVTATTTINSGTLQIGNGGAGGALSGSAVTINPPGSLAFNQTGTINFNGTISGSGNLIQNGAGILVPGNDSHTGSTLVNAGTLQVASGASSVGGSVITVNSGATLDLSPGSSLALISQSLSGTGTVKGDFFLGSGSLLAGTLTVTSGNITTGDSSTNAPGGFHQPGTLTVNGNYACGNNSYLVYDLATITNAGGGINDLLVVAGNLNLSQPCTLIINGTPKAGTYTLANFGSFTGSAANLTILGGSPRNTFSARVSGNRLLLDVGGGAANLAWRGDGSGNAWDNSLGLVWFNTGTSAADKFYPSDYTKFDDSSTNFTVNINATVMPSSLVVSAANNYIFTGSSDIGGDIPLTKTNTGTLTIQNNNTFTGPVNINGGTVSVATVAAGGPQPLGQGTALNLNGGAFQYTGAAAVDVGGFNRDINLGANGGVIDQASTSGAYFVITNPIAGSGSLTKVGNQQLILGDVATGTGSNNYSGGTYINAGNLQIRNAAALGTNTVWINAGGSLSEAGGFSDPILNNVFLQGGHLGGGTSGYSFKGTVTLVANSTAGSNSLTLVGPITGAGGLNINSGTVTLLNNNNNYSGGISVATNATLQLGTNGPNGWIAAQPAGVPLTNDGTIVFNSSATNVINFEITGSGGLTQNGVGYTVLAASNTFSGTLAVNGTSAGGGVLLTNSQAAGTGLISIAGVTARSTLQLAGNITVGNNFQVSQRPNGSLAPHILNIGGTNTLNGWLTLTSGGNLWMLRSDAGKMIIAGITNTAGSFARPLYLQGAADGVVSNIIDTTQAWLQIIKTNAGTWTIAGSASIGAGIQVNQGTLIVAGNVDSGTASGNASVTGGKLIVNGSLPGTVTVAGGGTLGGAGVIINAVTIQTGGTLAPSAGNGAATSKLTINSDLTLGGNLLFNLNKSLLSSNDAVVVLGSLLSNTGNGSLTLTNYGPALSAGDRFVLFSQPVQNGGSLTVTGGGTGVTWSNNLATDGSITVLTALPAVNTNSFAVGAVVSGGNLNLSWPPDRLGWKVQIQTNNINAGLGTNWVTLTDSASVTNYTIPINPANPSVFIRMVYP